MTRITEDTQEMVSWRCFHCGDVFTDEWCAREHFGPSEDSRPACLIKAGAEGSLVRALRDAEKEVSDAWAAIHAESTEAAQAYYRQQTRHHAQLQAAEEAGYERGLTDGRAEASQLAGVVGERDALRIAAEAFDDAFGEDDGDLHDDTPVTVQIGKRTTLCALTLADFRGLRAALNHGASL